jgi:hypothetical protein
MFDKIYKWFTRCCSTPETAVKNNHVECLKLFKTEILKMSNIMKQNLLNEAAFNKKYRRESLIYLVEELGLKFHDFHFENLYILPDVISNVNKEVLSYVFDNWDFDIMSKEDTCRYAFGQIWRYDWKGLRIILTVLNEKGFLEQSFFEKYKDRYIGQIPMTATCARFLIEELGFDLKEFIPSIDYLECFYIYNGKYEKIEDIEWILSYVTCPLVYESIGPLSLMLSLLYWAKNSLSTKIFVPYPNIQKLVFSKEHGAEKCKCVSKGEEICPFARLTKTI